MRNYIAGAALVLLAQPSAAETRAAPDLAGTWQGDPVHVLEFAHKKGGGYRGELHYLGESGGPLNGNPVSVTLSGRTITLASEREGSFEGTLSADGNLIAGTLKKRHKG